MRVWAVCLLVACGDSAPSVVATDGIGTTLATSGGPGSAATAMTASSTAMPTENSDGTGSSGSDTSADDTSAGSSGGALPSEERHWVGGDGDWTDAAHWSETAVGPGGASTPAMNTLVTIEGAVSVSLAAGDVVIRGLTCDGASLDAAVETEIAVGSGGADVTTCGLATDGGHALLGFRYRADATFDHTQGSAGGTLVDYLDADGNTITLRPEGDDEVGTDINAHHIDLGDEGAIAVDCALATRGCPENTRIEIQHASAHGCDQVDVVGTGVFGVGLEHESGSCDIAMIAAGYTFEGTVFDLTGGGNAPTFSFVPAATALGLDAPLLLEKQGLLLFNGQAIDSTSQIRIGNDQNPGTAEAVLDGAQLAADFVRLDDTDGATVDFSGGGTLATTGESDAHGTDLFVAQGGSLAGSCDSMAAPCGSVDRCIERANTLGGDARCLLRRGDTFDERGGGNPRTITASVYFDTHGAGAPPEVRVDAGDRLTATGEVRIYGQVWTAD